MSCSWEERPPVGSTQSSQWMQSPLKSSAKWHLVSGEKLLKILPFVWVGQQLLTTQVISLKQKNWLIKLLGLSIWLSFFCLSFQMEGGQSYKGAKMAQWTLTSCGRSTWKALAAWMVNILCTLILLTTKLDYTGASWPGQGQIGSHSWPQKASYHG